VILFVLPTISAVEHTTGEKSDKNPPVQHSQTIVLKRVQDLIKKDSSMKYPILFSIVFLQSMFRLIRGGTIFQLAVIYESMTPTITHPFLALRGIWLLASAEYECQFWNALSNQLGWNWPSLL
jgi:hypothetical protein